MILGFEMGREYYTAEQAEFIRSNAHLSRIKIAEMFNEKFNETRSAKSIQRWCSRHKLTGIENTGGFKKGNKPWNTGTKGAVKASKTCFKKGYTPANYRPLGSERIASSGHVLIKVDADNPRFVFKHRWIWEQENGEIPSGYNIVFKNGDKMDMRIENMMMVSHAELAFRNVKFSKVVTNETNETCFLLSKLYFARKELRDD